MELPTQVTYSITISTESQFANNRLDGKQLSLIENLDPQSPEMAEKIQQLAAQVPGLADDIEKKLSSDVEYIKQNSKIPG